MTISHASVHAQSHDPDEAKRWLIIGAYKAGAQEKAIARISGLSKTAVRQIILNFRQTGSPSLPKHVSRKVKDKPIVEYDEDGNLIDSDTEQNDNSEVSQIPTSTLPDSPYPPQQTKKPARQPRTKDVDFIEDQTYCSDFPVSRDQSKLGVSALEPSTPPRDNIRSQDVPSPAESFASTQHDSASMEACGSLRQHSLSCPISPPVPPVRKYDQTIRGYEIWTHEDDMILMEHMLTHLHGGKWRDIEEKLQGRHSARLCRERWLFLRSRLLKDIDHVGSDEPISTGDS